MSTVTLAQKALEIALSQEGVAEVPARNNTGIRVNLYLASVGLKPGYAWCAAFVYWAVNEAAKLLGIKNPLVKTGGVLRQYNETTCRKIPARSRAVKPGDIYIMDYGQGQGHMGIVVRVNGIGSILGIEGNTNDEGSREGYEVAIRTRLLSSIKGIIQLP